MASFGRKLMVYLGLSDEDYDEYEDYEEVMPAPPRTAATRSPVVPVEAQEPPAEAPVTSIRPVPRDEAMPTTSITPKPSLVRPTPSERQQVVHVVAPSRFSDAQEIADRLKSMQPVIVNLQAVDRDLARRMIDFCSGVTYALSGAMEKVAEQVFLLTPSNVSVTAEERQRISDRGLYSR